eukprot:434585-Prorocentrum_minimum.AAC.3
MLAALAVGSVHDSPTNQWLVCDIIAECTAEVLRIRLESLGALSRCSKRNNWCVCLRCGTPS